MSIFSLVIHKLKSFRMTVPSLILLVLASYRTLTSGYSIQLVGICASVVPFICQFKNFPKSPEGTSPMKDALSSYIMNLILMAAYLAYMLLLTVVDNTFFPGYVHNPHFIQMLMLALCANVVFISALIPVCRDLAPMQRMMPGILLCNAQLGFMMLAADYVKKAAPEKLSLFALGFIGLIFLLTFSFMGVCYGEKKKA